MSIAILAFFVNRKNANGRIPLMYQNLLYCLLPMYMYKLRIANCEMLSLCCQVNVVLQKLVNRPKDEKRNSFFDSRCNIIVFTDGVC